MVLILPWIGCQDKSPADGGSASLRDAGRPAAKLPMGPMGAKPRGMAAVADDLFQVPLGDSPSGGPRLAPVTAVLFVDLSDPASAKAFSDLQALAKRHPLALRWVFKHFPTVAPKTVGMTAARLAVQAARQGRFEAFLRAAFAGSPADQAGWSALAERSGLSPKAVAEALSSDQVMQGVLADRRLAARLAVRRAPGLFFNGRRVDPLGGLDAALATERARAEALLAQGIAPAALYDALTSPGRRSAWMVISKPDRPERFSKNPTAGQAVRDDRQTVQVDPGPGPAFGTAGAPVQLIMFAELSCSFCGQMIPVLGRLLRKHPQDLSVHLRWLPDRRRRAHLLDAAVLLQAAGSDEKIWELAGKLFEKPGGYDQARLLSLASEAGLNRKALSQALKQPARWMSALDSNRAEAERVGVRGSPYLFINGRSIPGATGVDTIERFIAEALAE